MRKYLRSIAHKNMEIAGYGHVNRKGRGGVSFFMRKWREFVSPKKRRKTA